MLRTTKSRRAALYAASLATIGLGGQSASAANRFFTADFGSWSNGALWTPSGAPTGTDIAMVGASSLTANGNVILDVDATVAGLSITDGMTVQAGFNQLTVNGNLTISGDNYQNGAGTGSSSRLYINHTIARPYDLRASTLNVTDGADLILGNTVVNVMNSMYVGSNSGCFGEGVLNFYGTGTVFSVDGDFEPGVFGNDPTSTFTLNQYGTGRIDLDGNVVGDRIIDIGGYHNSMTINGDQLTDSFDDGIWVYNGCSLNMNLSNGWSIGTGGGLIFLDQPTDSAAQLTGGTLTLSGGWLEAVGGSSTFAVALVDAPIVLNSGTVHVDTGNMTLKKSFTMNGGFVQAFMSDGIQFDGPVVINAGQVKMRDLYATATFNNSTTVNGGSLIAQDLTDIIFNGNTTINGGTFTSDFRGAIKFNGNTKVFGGTFNGVQSYTGIYFNGPTEYANTVNMTGEVQQNGTVTINNPATINAQQIDMDGASSLTEWNINAPLTINAAKINNANNNNNVFTGRLNLVSTPASPASLRINLPAGDTWTMSGGLYITGSGFGTVTDVIAGSDVNLSGPTKVSFDNAMSARVNFTDFNVTTINTASSLRLDGGTLAAPNTISGATIQGPGTLKSSTNHALCGYGTINAAVAFAGGELRADSGTLVVNGPISSVGVIGARQNATLKFGAPLNTGVATRLELNGGTVSGSTVTNTKQTHGFGTINTSGFVNNGSITVSGGTLVLNTAQSPDLDGTTETGVMLISSGTLRVPGTIADNYNGTAALGAAGRLMLEQGWTLGSGGLLSMGGTQVMPSHLVAPSQTIAGGIVVQVNSLGILNAKTTFAPGSSTTVNNGSRLELLQDGTIAQGATFAGAGSLRNNSGAALRLMENSNAQLQVNNAGTLEIGSFFGGQATAGRFVNETTGVFREDLFGPAPGTGYDRLNVTQTASVDGALIINPGLYNPAYLVPHEIIHASGGVSGAFTSVAGFALAPTKYLAVTYDADSVLVTAAIPGDANLDGSVNIGDFAILASKFNGTGVWSDGNFNGDFQVNIGDFSLLATNFNTHVMSGLPRGNAVPEPACAFAFAPLLLPRRRKRGS